MTSLPACPVLLESSLLASADYDARAHVLQLRFRSGATYRYFDVPRTIYEALLTADSKGSFFNSLIKGRFPYALVKPSIAYAEDSSPPADN